MYDVAIQTATVSTLINITAVIQKLYHRKVNIIQWNVDLSFFKGMEKTNDECGKTINTGNYYTL
jgi:hypothetical protein